MPPPHAVLEAELAVLKPRALQKRAEEAGVDDGLLDEAEDAAAIIALIVAKVAQEADSARLAAIEAELLSLRPRPLQKRAEEAGVDEAELDSAADSSAIVALILAKVSGKDAAVKARAEAEAEEQLAQLKEELQSLKPRQLNKRAEEAGVDEVLLDAAEDTAAIIDLIVTLKLVQPGGPFAQTKSRGGITHRPTPTATTEQLRLLPPSQLRKRAVEEGIDSTAIEAAEDAARPKEAMVALILAAAKSGNTTLRTELEKLTPSQRRKRAVSAGISASDIEAAEDGENPKDAMIQLILIVAGSARSAPPRSHTGSGARGKETTAHGGARAIVPAGKHVMLSYNWANQEAVSKANASLTAKGIPCWMDISGGMQTDIYDSMAQGVQGAAVVVCFMSKTYQTSENCKLELKFAQQTGTPIVPVMMEDLSTQWKPTDWLGVITAGALWIPLVAAQDFEENIASLIGQIKLAAGTSGSSASEEAASGGDERDDQAAEDLFSLDEMRQELERLRADGVQPALRLATKSGVACPLPGVVPAMQGGLVVSDSMHVLVDTVISPASKHRRVGFWGTGE